MQNLLLSTKMRPPSTRHGLILRPALADVLEDSLDRRLTLVSAPAGFGKTMLVSQWARDTVIPSAWLTLDSGDNDPSRFLEYLFTTLHGAAPTFDPEGLPIPPSMGPDHIEPVATAVINELAAINGRLALILDDFHRIENPVLHGFLQVLVEHLPAQHHICLLTRVDPPLPLSRWRGLGELQEIRAADLRFTGEEVRRYLDGAVKTALTEREIEVIEAKNEGWITGLQLTALSLGKQEDSRRFVQSFSGSHEYIADYLTDEVISRQPTDIQSFLLKTSILEHMSGDLCDAVMDQSGSQSILERLEHQNLFVVPLDTDRQWYRYHQLFADLLRKRLHSLYPHHVSELHARASRWHEQQGLIDEAIRYASAVVDSDRVLSLIEQHILDTILRGQYYQANAWLRTVPEGCIEERPVLCAAEAWTSIRSLATDRAHRFIRRAEELTREQVGQHRPGELALIGRHVATLKAAVARTEGRPPEEQLVLIRQALEVVPRTEQALWGMLILRRGLCHLDLGNDRQADQAFEEAITAGDPTLATHSFYGAVYARTIVAHLQGRLRDIEELCSETLRGATDIGGAPWQRVSAHAFAHTALGLVELEWNNLDNAAYHLRRGLALNAASGVTELRIKALYALGRLAIACGKPPEPIEPRVLPHGVLPGLADFAEALQVHLWLLAAQTGADAVHSLDLARQWAASQSLLPVEGRDRDWQIKRQLVFIRVVLALAGTRLERGLPGLTAARHHLDHLQGIGSALGWVDRVIEVLIVKALVLNALGDQNAARGALIAALELAEPWGYVRTFLDEGPAIARLLYGCTPPESAVSAYAGHLLAQFSRESTALSPSTGHQSDLVRPLTPREVEVLDQVAEGLTNLEIGQRLSIALGTVKRHIANINDKLNTRTRTQAVTVARSLGILR